MLEKSCNQFMEELASSYPVPGGGSVAAYVSALGMALGEMVGALTTGKIKYKAVEAEIIEINASAEIIRVALKELAEEDIAVFLPLSEAYRLPSGTEEERQYKSENMERALVLATQVPIKIAELTLQAIKLHDRYFELGTSIAISDVGVGVLLCKSALQSAQLNVLINTKMIKDEHTARTFENKVSQIVQSGTLMADTIYKNVMSRIER